MSYLPPRIIPYPLTNQSGDSQLGIDTNGIGDCNNPVLFGDGEEPIPVLVVLTGKQWERIYGALLFGADVIYPNAREQVLFDFTKWWDCPLDICEIIRSCIGAQLEALQSSVDALSTSVTNISNTVNNIETSTENSSAKPPSGITFTDASFRCGGALALVDYMHAQNMSVYAEAEASAVDNISEMIIAVLKSIPALETLPVGALGALTQSYFENQVLTYEADFGTARIEMASLLACLIEANDNQLTYDVWGDWLETLEAEIPSNAAAELFARYSPARQTLLNQIAALLNADQSLEAYFKQLFTAYNAGEDNPSNACESCPDYTITRNAGTPVQSEISGVLGEPLVVESVFYTVGAFNVYQAAIGLQDGGDGCMQMESISLSGYTPYNAVCNAATTNCSGTTTACTYHTSPTTYTNNGARRYLAFNSTTPFTLTVTIQSIT